MYKQIIWDITNKCNLKCIHCYATSKYNELSIRKDLDFEKSKILLNNVKKLGYNHVLLLGGEPLIRDQLIEIIEYARNLDIEIMINSNGIFMTRQMAETLVDLGVKQISISFQGTCADIHDQIAGKGTFEKSVQGLKNLVDVKREKESKIIIGIQFTLTKITENDCVNLIKFALQNEVDGISITFLDYSGRAYYNNDKLAQSWKEFIDVLELLMDSIVIYKNELPEDFIFQINSRKLLLTYLSHKYGIDIKTNITGCLCPAGDKVTLIENDGTITPCGTANNDFFNIEFINNNDYIHQKLNILNYDNEKTLYNTEYFSSFFEFKSKNMTAHKMCNSCSYHDECQICPILYKSEILQCMEIKKRYDEYKEKLFSEPVKCDDKNELKKLCKKNEITQFIINKMCDNELLINIAIELSIMCDVDVETIKNDILELHYLLKTNGLLA